MTYRRSHNLDRCSHILFWSYISFRSVCSSNTKGVSFKFSGAYSFHSEESQYIWWEKCLSRRDTSTNSTGWYYRWYQVRSLTKIYCIRLWSILGGMKCYCFSPSRHTASTKASASTKKRTYIESAFSWSLVWRIKVSVYSLISSSASISYSFFL